MIDSIIIKNEFPLKCWKEIINNFADGVPCFIETNLENLDITSDLFIKYSNEYKWHFRDSMRSMNKKMERNLNRYEFSYHNRMTEYFGINQIQQILQNNNSLLCNWDSRNDFFNSPKPCFVTMKIIKDGGYFHLSCTYRTRDIIRRMYPNFIALKVLSKSIENWSELKMGKLFDYNNQIICKKQDLDKITSWKEFQDYN